MCTHRHPVPAREQSGFVLIAALFFAILMVGIVASGSITMRALDTKVDTTFARHAQATQIARSGLIEGLSWFRRQTKQPVLTFEPLLDSTATPPVLDTDDPYVGLVRQLEITESVWGRYEVWKRWDTDPVPSRLLWRQKVEAQDVGTLLGTTSGGAWRLRSVGYVYRLRDPNKAFNELPNHVIAVEMLEGDIRRMALNPPGQAAINIRRGSNLTVNTMGRVTGGPLGAGVYFPQGTGNPQPYPLSGTRVTGSPQFSPTSTPYDDSIEAVFGVSRQALLAMADDVVKDMADFPVPVPQFSIVVVDTPSVKFDADTPLRSTAAIVYVEGNVSLMPGSMSIFNGLLFVDGNLSVREPCELRGSIIVTGNMTVQGSSDYADVYFDDGVLNTLRQNIGNYRLSSALRRPEIR